MDNQNRKLSPIVRKLSVVRRGNRMYYLGMRKKKVGSQQLGNDSRKGAEDSSSAVVTELSPINEENLWNEGESRVTHPVINPTNPPITEASLRLLIDVLPASAPTELWEIVKNSNQHRDVILPEEELKALFNKVFIQKTISFKSLMEQEFPPARYVIEPFFEVGAVNMLSAPPNNWKSWFLFYFASCIAGGNPVFGKFPTEKAGILIVNEEDSHRSVQDRFKILKITDPTLEIYFRIASGAKLTKKFIEEIILECKEKNLTMVMFDSLRSMHEADENDSTTMQGVMDLLKILAREGITVLFTHHNRKKSLFNKGDDAEASRGSSAINAAVSGYISLEEEERETGKFVVVRHLKSKVGEKLPSFEIKVIKEENTIEFNYEGEFKSGEKKLHTSKQAIMAYIKPGDLKSVNDIYALEIAGKNIARTAMNALVTEGVLITMTRKQAREKGLDNSIGGNPKEKLYSLPTEESEAVQQEFDDF